MNQLIFTVQTALSVVQLVRIVIFANHHHVYIYCTSTCHSSEIDCYESTTIATITISRYFMAVLSYTK